MGGIMGRTKGRTIGRAVGGAIERTVGGGRRVIALFIGTVAVARDRGERGLSQSTENAVLLAGAVTVAGIVVAAITTYVKTHLPG